MRIGLITCHTLPEPDPDAAVLAAALRSRGHTPVEVAWDDPHSRPDALDLLVLRSPWNYHERPEDFLRWIDGAAASAPLINSPAIVRWNLHKGYLLRLADASVPVVPTRLLPKGAVRAADAERALNGFGGVVIKPAIGAGSVGVRRFNADQHVEALAWLETFTAQSDALVQPYIEGFQNPGERSLIRIDSKWTHAIRKRPRFAGEHEQVDASEPPTRAEIAVAESALAVAPTGCKYARADLVTDSAGRTLVSELELIEPSLYFQQSAEALSRFVSMVEATATASSIKPRPPTA